MGPRGGHGGGWVGFGHVAEVFMLFVGYCCRVSECAVPHSESMNPGVGVLFGDVFEEFCAVPDSATIGEEELRSS